MTSKLTQEYIIKNPKHKYHNHIVNLVYKAPKKYFVQLQEPKRTTEEILSINGANSKSKKKIHSTKSEYYHFYIEPSFLKSTGRRVQKKDSFRRASNLLIKYSGRSKKDVKKELSKSKSSKRKLKTKKRKISNKNRKSKRSKL